MKFQDIKPYVGLDFLKLYSNLEDVKSDLILKQINFEELIYDNSDCDVKYNWHVLVVDDSVSLFFSEGNFKLFKICISNDCEAKLPNGIRLGMNMNDAQNIDSTIVYDEFEEIYLSVNGYWVEDNVETDEVLSITVFVKEINDDNFLQCDW